MNPVPILTNKYTILVNDVDFTRKLKLSSILNFFQETASMHARNLGLGIDTLVQDLGVVWALVRIRLDIIRYPQWNEEITIETWPQAPRRFEFERDFIMRDKDGNVIARAVSVWVMMDMKTRRLTKPEVSLESYPDFNTDRAIDCSLGKLKPISEPSVSYKRLIGCSDIDMNGHLNNSKYLDFIMDCFSMEHLKKYEVSSIQVNYINEVLPGGTIVLYKAENGSEPGIVHIEGASENNGSDVFRAVIEIRET